jgi:CBS domain-containing protein|tara:strand:- start:3787 stop:4221 length:435 start_codon:yes stop_codon:yes gene_type:complete
MKTVEEVMRKRLDVEKGDVTVSKAVKAMHEKNVRSVLVSSKDDIVGIVTSTDVLYKVIAKNKDPGKTVLKDIMSSPIHAIGPGNTLKEAADLMSQHKIKKLPVIDEKDGLIGILTASIILSADPEFLDMLVNLQIPVEKTLAGS